MRILIHILLLVLLCGTAAAQSVVDAVEGISFNEDVRSSRRNRTAATPGDSTRTVDVPVGMTVWRVDETFGSIIPDAPDTLMHRFPQRAFTAGPTMRYNTTGNLGAPRMSRIFSGQDERMATDPFIFARPFDYFLFSPSQFLFTNTKSPFTNLTYNTCGTRTNGEDRITAKFAVNAGKRLGLGFKLDYLYGRGYYQNQNTSHFGGTLFGSYRGERYRLHAYYNLNHLKNAENGGLEDDIYITHPERLSTSYREPEMPVRLQAYNYMNVNTLFLTHAYDLGFTEVVAHDTIGAESLTRRPEGTVILPPAEEDGDTLAVVPRMAFRPVASVIHTMRLQHNWRQFLSNNPDNLFFADRYLPSDTADDKTRNFSLHNLLALEMREGFRPWVKTGMRLFAQHQYDHFTLLDGKALSRSYNENHITVGAQLMREQGKLFHYNVVGSLRTSGKEWGEFNVEGWAQFSIPLRRDSLRIRAFGYVRNESPSFYYRHYHGRNAWWDDDGLHNIFRTRIGGELRWNKTRLTASVENTKNYTHFAHTITNGTLQKPCYSLGVVQATGNIQTLQATLCQDFSWGPLRWENELTVQHSSSQEHLPLPLFMGYTNLYLKFCIAHVLNTELGADLRYFTAYEAPDYNPAVGQFATQDSQLRTKIGNYPWVNVYVNFQLKRARFYVMYTHVNKYAGSYFLTPHYPTNERILRLGISWSFIN